MRCDTCVMLQGSCHCGAVRWVFDGRPDSATACNCTVCRRYAALWAYGYENEGITVSGPTSRYVRGDQVLGFHFCNACGCMAYWRALEAEVGGRRRMGVNLRLAEPDGLVDIPVRRVDWLDESGGLPMDGRRISDFWV